MKRFLRCRALCLLALCLCLSLGDRAFARDFTVLSFSPKGQVSGKQEIKVVFSNPLVEDSMLGKIVPKDQLPLEIRPPLKGHGVWDNSDTFVFTSEKALSPATEYEAVMKPIRDISGNLLAGAQSFKFKTPPLKLMAVRQVAMEGSVMTLEVRFSLEVPPQRLLGFVKASSSEADFRVIPEGEAPSDRITLKVQGVAKGDPVTLTLEKGLASDLGPLGLEKTETVVLEPSFKLQITGNYGETERDGIGRLSIYTSGPVDPGDVKGFVSLSPQKEFRIEPLYGGFALVGEFLPRDRYTVTLKKGLGGKMGLDSDRTLTFVMPDRERSLAFPVTGTFLSSSEEPRIPLDTVNLDKVTVSAWKLYSNNIPVVTGALGSGGDPSKSLSKFLGSKTYDLDNRLNKTVRGALDLKELLGDTLGVFLIEAYDPDGWQSARQIVTLTDTGVSARVFDKSLLIWAVGLSSAKPFSGAEVAVYSSSNQLLGKGNTDSNGVFVLQNDGLWDPQLRPSVATVEQNGDLSFVAIWGDGFSDSAIDVSGAPWVKSYEACCLMPRGVFRPGEKVDVTSVVRGPKMSMPGDFPVLWRAFGGPMDLEIAKGQGILSENGVFSGSFSLPKETPTGDYDFQITLPGSDWPLGTGSFIVQDFTPPKIELEISSDRTSVSSGSDVNLTFQASYLFGAPSPGLQWEIQSVASPRDFESKLFPGYVFGDREIKFHNFQEYVDSGVLDENGKGTFTWTVPEHWKAPSMIDLSLVLNAMEPGGRWVTGSLTLPCSLTPHQIGIKAPKETPLPGKAASFAVATVTELDEAVSVPLRWELFKVYDRYVLVREGGRSRMKRQEEKVSVQDGTFSTDRGKGTIAATPDSEGAYLLKIEDGRGSSASFRFYSYSSFGSSALEVSVQDRIELKLDKELYKAGDRGALAYRSPFPGIGLFTVESEGLIKSQVLELETSGKIEFTADEDLWPNGWCTLQVIRPVGISPNFGNFRALGAAPVFLDTSDSKAFLEIKAPSDFKPKGSLEIPITVRDSKGNLLSGELWGALVDKGILDLTAFNSPDPYGLFTSKRELGSKASDIYDDLMPIESRETPLLHPSGGDSAYSAMAMNLSPLQARGFKVLSIVKGPVEVKDGEALLEFQIPEFSGGVRLMAVFMGKNLGSSESRISLARDLVLDPTLAQVLAPGDQVFVPVQVISKSERDLDLTIDVKTSGPLAYRGQNPLNFQVKAFENMAFELPVEALAESGYGVLTMDVENSLGDRFTLDREVTVRPPMPRVTLSRSASLKKGALTPKEEGPWLPGTLKSDLYISGTKKADMLPLLSFLLGYPYQCLEQTVSKTWPLVIMPEMVMEMENLTEDEIKSSLSDNLAHIQTLQLYDGSFTYWPSWEVDEWGSIYASHLMALSDQSLVPKAMAERSKNHLLSVLTDEDESPWGLSKKAYGAYVLALKGKAPMGWMAWLLERLGKMDDNGRLFLAGAYGLAGQKKQALSMLGGFQKKSQSSEVFLPSMALKLLVMGHVSPGSPEEAMLAEELIKALDGRPLSTYDAGMCVLALGQYLKRADTKPFKGELLYGGEVFPLAAGDELSLSSDSFVPWTLKNSGPGPIYASWTLSGVPLEPSDESDRGVSIQRTIEDRDGNPLDLTKALELGQEVSVVLQVTPLGDTGDLVIADVLPGCFEVWDQGLELGRETVNSRKEVRFDRVIIFPDSSEESFVVGYRCRVTARGNFALPPSSVQDMYDPSVKSLKGGGKITVR